MMALRKELGDGWSFLVPRARQALVAERALDMLRARDGRSATAEEMDALLEAMLREAGIS
jgi:hypothetical protein